MKKYFTKFLPFKGGFKRVVKSAEGIPVDFEQEVKLFLCTKNIQVGDECYHIKYPEIGKWAIKEGGFEDCVDWHGENVDDSDLYKVVGQISPDALSFVKEGDEFSEEQIKIEKGKRYSCVCPNENGNFCADEYLVDDHRGGNFCNRMEEYVNKIQIKGPCSHFH